jgi:hypothetical protein
VIFNDLREKTFDKTKVSWLGWGSSLSGWTAYWGYPSSNASETSGP